MEPETSRKIPADAGSSKRPDLREETPGEEAKGADGSAVGLRRKGGDEAGECDDVKSERGGGGQTECRLQSGDEEDAGKHEEELDPRIQVRC